MLARVFLSYAHPDRRAVEGVAKSLVAAGHEAWIDVEDIRAGESWRRRIVQSIAESDALVVFLSSSSGASRQVATEVHLASEAGKPIFPVMLEDAQLSEDIRYDIAGLQFIDLSAEGKTGTSALIDGLDALAVDAIDTPQSKTEPPRRRVPSNSKWKWIAVATGVFGAAIVGGIVLINAAGSSPDETSPSPASLPSSVSIPEASEFQPTKTVTRTCGGGKIQFTAGPVDDTDPDVFEVPFAVQHQELNTQHNFNALTAFDDRGRPYKLEGGEFGSPWSLDQDPFSKEDSVSFNKNAANHPDAIGIVIVVMEKARECQGPFPIPVWFPPG